jgi:hypothetical protein
MGPVLQKSSSLKKSLERKAMYFMSLLLVEVSNLILK